MLMNAFEHWYDAMRTMLVKMPQTRLPANYSQLQDRQRREGTVGKSWRRMQHEEAELTG